jgi:hypothetical protein
MPSTRPSASIVAAGICACLLGALLAVLSILAVSFIRHMDLLQLPPEIRTMARALAIIACIILLSSAAYLVACGLGVIGLRRWARISVIAIAALLLLFGVVGAIAAFISIIGIKLPGGSESKIELVETLVATYGIPIVAAIWWLILFTRRSVVLQFEARSAESPAKPSFRIQKQGLPVPIAVVAWVLLTNFLNVLILPFLPFRVPMIMFGRVFHGMAGTTFIISLSVLVAVSSFGLLRLQRWSFPASVALQVVAIANLLLSALSSRYPQLLQEMIEEMHLPSPPGAPDIFSFARYFALIGVLVPLAFLFCLLWSRREFYAAATRASSPTSLP